MDKRNTIIGIVLITAAFGLMFRESSRTQERMLEEAARTAESAESAPPEDPAATAEPSSDGGDSAGDAPAVLHPQADNGQTESVASSLIEEIGPAEADVGDNATTTPETREPEQTHTIENEFIRVHFTSYGGAIRQVELLQFADRKGSAERYVFNEIHDVPALSISLEGPHGSVDEYAPPYELVDRDNRSITYRLEISPGVELRRTYALSASTEGAAPYTITHTTQVENRTVNQIKMGNIYVNLGTVKPTDADRQGMYMKFGYWNGADIEFIALSKFRPGGFLFWKNEGMDQFHDEIQTVWASVKNQFFTAILTPRTLGTGVYAKTVDFPPQANPETIPLGMTGAVEFGLGQIGARKARLLEMDYYVGPKEFPRISQLGQEQDLVMDFGWFGFLSKLLLHLLLFVGDHVHSFGVAIMMVTLLIRGALWPLTAQAARSSKKMAKLREPMQELREKYKDNPQKMQEKTMQLFKEHKVNPAAGCLPIFIQIPIFLSFFYMLRSAAELRFEGFLWIQDLSLPDTIAEIGGFPVNPLPIIMTISMWLQMKMQPTPTMDRTQQKIFQFMPFMFLIFLYNFSSGLALYWTTSNCFSIFQQYLTNRSRDPEEAAAAPAGSGDKTPAKPSGNAAKRASGSATRRAPGSKRRKRR